MIDPAIVLVCVSANSLDDSMRAKTLTHMLALAPHTHAYAETHVPLSVWYCITYMLHDRIYITERWPKSPRRTNSAIFATVHKFIVRTNRFSVVHRAATEPWPKRHASSMSSHSSFPFPPFIPPPPPSLSLSLSLSAGTIVRRKVSLMTLIPMTCFANLLFCYDVYLFSCRHLLDHLVFVPHLLCKVVLMITVMAMLHAGFF